MPVYAVIFTQLALINGLVDATNGPMIAAALATGKIKKYELILSSISLFNLPLAYIVLKLGCDPTSTMIISIAFSCLGLVLRAFLLKEMIKFPLIPYFTLVLKIFTVTFFMIIGIIIIVQDNVESIFDIIFYSFSIDIVLTLLYAFVIERSDRHYVIHLIKSKFALIK